MKKFSKKQWIKFGIAAVLYILFSIWMQNLWLLLGLIVLVDIFLTHYIPWGAWKRSKNPAVRNALEWVDDILFALIAVYFINLFVFQNYQIPSSSLEKSLLVGDYLFVSKLSYGRACRIRRCLSRWYRIHCRSSTANRIWIGRNGATSV